MKLTIKKDAEKNLKNSNLPDILSCQQVAMILGIGRVSVYHLIEERKLTAFRIGRTYYVQKQSVQQYIETRGENK